MWSLDEVQSQISSIVDQSSTTPAVGSADYALRRTLVNRALRDFGEAYDWTFLIKEVNTRTSISSSAIGGLATVALPTDFSKFTTFPKVSWDSAQTNEFAEIDVKEQGQYIASDKYFYLLYSAPTVTMILHSSLVSGASIYFAYKASPGSLASPVNVAAIPDPTYIVQKALYYYFQSTEDARFVEAGQTADLILQRMLEDDASKGNQYVGNRARTWLETVHKFKIGRD